MFHWRCVFVPLLALNYVQTLFGAAPAFTPGHIYAPYGNSIIELDGNLTKVGSISVSSVRSSGATFNSSRDLVVICQDASNEVYVREVNAAGQTIRQFDTGEQTLLLGSYIAFDPSRAKCTPLRMTNT